MISRRNLLLAAAPLMSARSYARISGSGERLRIGVIGCGGMGGAHMTGLLPLQERDNFTIAAVCDIYDKRLDEAAAKTGAKPYRDYRRVLDDKDIDYVLLTTPEHWRYQMAADAAEAGKAIYCEKPMTHTAEEAKRLVATVRRTGVKLQVGIQGMSDDSYETANGYVKKGVLGQVVIAQIDYSRNHIDDFWNSPIDQDAKPGVNLDWKSWLGRAPKRPWSPERYFRWRNYWDYSGGIASDLFVHRVTRIIRSLGLTFPDRAVAGGGTWEFRKSLAEVPETFNVTLDYPGGPTVLLVSSMANDTPVDHVLRGHRATLQFTQTGFVIRPQKLFEKDVSEIVFRKTGAEDLKLHHRNLMAAVRKGEPLKCDSTLGYYGVVACDMSVQAFRTQRYMKWDRARERIFHA